MLSAAADMASRLVLALAISTCLTLSALPMAGLSPDRLTAIAWVTGTGQGNPTAVDAK